MIRNLKDYISDSMEMYLVTIARLREPGLPVPLSKLADELSVTSVSVNEMCRKLQDQGYLVYQPYQGAKLTESGEKLATDTLRRHRIWEVFLVEKLGFKYLQAHEIACQMEHAATDDVIDKLDKFLGYPSTNPIGYPIPKRVDGIDEPAPFSLKKISVGSIGIIAEIQAPEDVRNYLFELGIAHGKEVKLNAIGQDMYLLKVNKKDITISAELAGTIYIHK